MLLDAVINGLKLSPRHREAQIAARQHKTCVNQLYLSLLFFNHRREKRTFCASPSEIWRPPLGHQPAMGELHNMTKILNLYQQRGLC